MTKIMTFFHRFFASSIVSGSFFPKVSGLNRMHAAAKNAVVPNKRAGRGPK